MNIEEHPGFDPDEQGREGETEEELERRILAETAENMRYDEKKVDRFEQQAVEILHRNFMIPDLTNTERLYLRNEVRKAMLLAQNNVDQEKAILDSADIDELMANRTRSHIDVAMEAVFHWFKTYLNIDVMNWDSAITKMKDYDYTINPETKGVEITNHKGQRMPVYMAAYRANPAIHQHVLNLIEKRRRNDDDQSNP